MSVILSEAKDLRHSHERLPRACRRFLASLGMTAIVILVGGVALGAEKVPPEHVAYGAEEVVHKQAHPEEDHGAGHEQPKTYFGIPAWLLKLINMLLFIGLLVWLLRGPIGAALRDRSARITTQLNESRERNAKADRLAEEIQGRLSRLEGEVAMVLKRAEEDGERQKQELIAAANDEAEKILRAARSEVDARVKQARKELTDYAGELAAARAQQLLEETLTDADRKKIFDESVQSIAERRS